MFKSQFPRDFDRRQNEFPNRNMMGSKSEISHFPKYKRLREYNKVATLTFNENRRFCFYQETNRLLENLQLSIKLRVFVLINAEGFYAKLKKGSRYRSVNSLIPVSIYITCLERFIFAKRKLFYDYCDKINFNRCYMAILRENNSLRLKLLSSDFRIKTILVQLNGLRCHFNLSELFFKKALRNLYQHYYLIKNTKLEVITGRIFNLTIKSLNEKFPITKMCNFLGISRSSIYWRVV